MQPSAVMGTGPVQGVSSVSSCLSNGSSLGGLQNQMHSPEEQQQLSGQAQQQHFPPQYEQTGQHAQPNMDDFFEQMFSMPWDYNASNNNGQSNSQKLLTMSLLTQQESDNGENLQYYDESALLACRLRQHHLNGSLNHVSQGINETNNSPGRSMMLQLNSGNPNSSQMLTAIANSPRGPVGSPPPLPLSLGQSKPGDISEPPSREDIVANNARDSNLGALFPPFPGAARALRPPGTNFQPQPAQVQMQGYGGVAQPQHANPPPPAPVGAPPARPRVRARRGQATDPHSIAERLRRERIAERMKALQELVPNSNKTDKASMLDEIIEYVKFLQLQVKVLSMSRLGGAGAVAPLVTDLPSEGGNQHGRSNGNQNPAADGLALTERQVAKLMEEDMGSAMQYLQGKGLCLMPISLATAISTTNRNQASQHPSPLQGLMASANASDRQLVEPTNSSLSAITSLSSSNDAENAKKAGSAVRPANKDGREANSVTKANGIGTAGGGGGIKGDEESQSRRTAGGQGQ